MKYRLFLFDLDDTLLDFRASEKLSFARTMLALGCHDRMGGLFQHYQAINVALWKRFEEGAVSKDFLKVERFRQAFVAGGLELDPEAASRLYLEALPESVVLVDGALALCEALCALGEVGIVTNGIDYIQQRRIASSGLRQHVSFVATSEACGFAKPDIRFFEYASRMARAFVRAETVIVGDRLDADILGANRFGIDSCWFNPAGAANHLTAHSTAHSSAHSSAVPSLEVASLHEVMPALASGALHR